MKLGKFFSIILFVTLFAFPACTLTGFAVKEYKPNNRQKNIEYSPEYPLAGSEENRIFVGLVKMTIVNYTEYHLTVKYVGDPGGAVKRRYFRQGNSLVLDMGKKKLRLRAIRSLNKQKKLKDGRVEEFNQYRLSWSGLGAIGRAKRSRSCIMEERPVSADRALPIMNLITSGDLSKPIRKNM